MQQDLHLNPYMKFDQAHKFLNQSTYKLGESSLFFLSNFSLSEEIRVNAEFMVKGKQTPWLWDTETGDRYILPSEGNKLKLTIPRATSMMIVFDDDADGEKYNPVRLKSSGRDITGPWQLELNHINGENTKMELPSLQDLTLNSQTKGFAGTATYTKSITLSSMF